MSFDGLNTCSQWIGSDLGPSSPPLFRAVKTSGIHYRFGMEWMEGCTALVDSQNVHNPLGSDTPHTQQCTNIFYDCYKNCKSVTLQ